MDGDSRAPRSHGSSANGTAAAGGEAPLGFACHFASPLAIRLCHIDTAEAARFAMLAVTDCLLVTNGDSHSGHKSC